MRQWPVLWEEPRPIGQEEAREEKVWEDTTFLGDEHQTYVGKLGTLLGLPEDTSAIRSATGKQYVVIRKDLFPKPMKVPTVIITTSSTTVVPTPS
jgi:hypothetical protein